MAVAREGISLIAMVPRYSNQREGPQNLKGCLSMHVAALQADWEM